MLKSAILRTKELDTSCVFGGGGLKEALEEEVFIFPGENEQNRKEKKK